MGQVTSYELGIVFPLKEEAEIDRVVCYGRPAKRYGSRDRLWASFLKYVLLQGAHIDAQTDVGGPARPT